MLSRAEVDGHLGSTLPCSPGLATPSAELRRLRAPTPISISCLWARAEQLHRWLRAEQSQAGCDVHNAWSPCMHLSLAASRARVCTRRTACTHVITVIVIVIVVTPPLCCCHRTLIVVIVAHCINNAGRTHWLRAECIAASGTHGNGIRGGGSKASNCLRADASCSLAASWLARWLAGCCCSCRPAAGSLAAPAAAGCCCCCC